MAPAVEAVVDRRREAVVLRTILPAAIHLQNMDNHADDATVIHPLPAARPAGSSAKTAQSHPKPGQKARIHPTLLTLKNRPKKGIRL